MPVVKLLRKMKFIPPQRLLELYPPFLFMGVKVKHVAKDYTSMRISVPLRWYGTNQYGSMFGGIVCAVSDPLPALLCSRLFPGHEIWTRKNCVEFLRPARGTIEANVALTREDLEEIEKELAAAGRTTREVTFMFRDHGGHDIARVVNTVYLRRGGKGF